MLNVSNADQFLNPAYAEQQEASTGYATAGKA